MKNYIYKRASNSISELNLKYSMYLDKSKSPKGVLLYFHGGGLLYGNRNDLLYSVHNALLKNMVSIDKTRIKILLIS